MTDLPACPRGMPLPAETQPADPTRRRMIGFVIAIWGALAAGFSIPFLRYFTSALAPALPTDRGPTAELDRATLDLGPLWTPVTLTVAHRDAWIASTPQTQVAFLREKGGAVEGLSSVCSHLGCQVNWVAESYQFVCPCHHGRYDINGQVVGGPPPRPLARLPIEIRGDKIVVLLGNGGTA